MFEIVEEKIIDGLKNGKNMIYDATNINYKKRMAFLQKINKMDVEKIAIMVATPYNECLERNASRERQVPEEVIKRMYYNFYVPQCFEGFDDIIVKYNSDFVFFFEDLKDMPHDNPHHELSILEHCKKVERILARKIEQEITPLIIAGRLHDIGKIQTKTFINTKGETTEIAHYYSHENVSAYDSLFYLSIRMRLEKKFENEFALDTIKLIQWHMLLHKDLSEKTINKYKKMFGKDIWNDLELLHEADCEAK